MTTRPLETYNPRYLRNKTQILEYRRTHKAEIAAYMRSYMQSYTKRPAYATHKERMIIRSYLTSRLPSAAELAKRTRSYRRSSAIGMLGMTRAELAAKYNMSERKFKSYVSARVVDHIVTRKFLVDNHPEYLPFFSRWYNLQFVSARENNRKHAWVDTSNPNVQRILGLMEAEAKIKAS